MLGPQFREGSVPRSSEKPLELLLPDDDPRAVEAFCRISHHSTSDRKEEHGGNMFLELMKFGDKYDCMQVIGPRFQQWLRNFIERGLLGKEDNDLVLSELWKAITVSFVLDDERSFNEASRKLVRKWNGKQEDQVPKLDFDFFGPLKGQADEISTLRKRVVQDIEGAVSSMITALIEDDSSHHNLKEACENCRNEYLGGWSKTCEECNRPGEADGKCTPEDRLWNFMSDLKSFGVWPLSSIIGDNLHDLVVTLTQLSPMHSMLKHHACSLTQDLAEMKGDVSHILADHTSLGLAEFKRTLRRKEEMEEPKRKKQKTKPSEG
ncbi:MAG: hypothetical protein M1823_004189 [Watsoniomyces obsoletus]|nr:MAG: hypothetical protein M1823_004189 [Watsoniomyces obsoletus]